MSILKEKIYCFISGKNWKLSLAELVSYMDARGYFFEISEFSRSFFTIKIQDTIEATVIDDLGGTLKMAEKAASVPTGKIVEAFLKENKQIEKQLRFDLPLDVLAEQMPRAVSGKSVFGVSVYWADPSFRHAARAVQRFLGNWLKDELKDQDKKTRFMGFPRERKNPQLTPVEVLKQCLIKNHSEVLLWIGKQETSIGTTLAVHNPFEFQNRDVDKPVQRKIFGISPRVAKIMVNLTHCTSGKVFLDPFCGVGNILQEALLAKARVIGVDINRWCVDASKRNLDWLTREYFLEDADYLVMQGDVRNLREKIREEIDCIATEPDLGPALREVPTTPYAEKILENLMPLFNDFLLEAYAVMRENGFLVLVTPYVKTRSGKPVTMNITELAQSVGFSVIKPFEKNLFIEAAADFPLRELACLIDVDERHKIGRQINIYQKTG